MSHHEGFPPPLAAFKGAAPPAPEWFTQALAQAPERSTVMVEGAAIETLAWGRLGDPGLLLLHGNSAHADWYSFMAPPLAAQGRRVVALSFSGMGASDWRERYAVAQWAEEALVVAETTGLFEGDQAPVVAGHSFGGFPLIALAARHGQRLKRAIIIDTPLRPPEGMQAREAKRRERAAAGPVQARVYASEAEALARFRFLPPQGCEHPFIADFIARRSLKPAVDAHGHMGVSWRFDPNLFHHFDFGHPNQDLRAARCPVMLVRGGRSRLITPELLAHAQAMAPEGTVVREVPDADHHVMVDQPLALVRLLGEWANELVTL
jgi:pimeloyl-ACP methyl ester carboxylesterase